MSALSTGCSIPCRIDPEIRFHAVVSGRELAVSIDHAGAQSAPVVITTRDLLLVAITLAPEDKLADVLLEMLAKGFAGMTPVQRAGFNNRLHLLTHPGPVEGRS